MGIAGTAGWRGESITDMPPKGSKKKGAKGKAARKGKKEKKVKDPNAPKRPMSAYFLFMNAYRPKVKKENPDFGIGDIAKELGRQWAEIAPAEKSKFDKEAAIAKKKWEAEKAAYLKKGGGKAAAKEEGSEEEEEEEEAEEAEDSE